MQENITIARPYAQAVFETASGDNNFADWSAILELLSDIVADPQMQSLLRNPTIKSDFLADMIIEICGDRTRDEGRNFIRVLAAARRLALAPQIRTLFEQQRAEAEGVVEVTVKSAYPLEQGEIDRIAGAMGRRLGKKTFVTTIVDKDLIGGVVIRTGDSVIDASVMGRLKQLGSHLAE